MSKGKRAKIQKNYNPKGFNANIQSLTDKEKNKKPKYKK